MEYIDFEQNLRAKTMKITGSARLRAFKNASKCIFWSFCGVLEHDIPGPKERLL